VEQNISLLGKIAAMKGYPAGISASVPNPVVWSTAARGYMSLVTHTGQKLSDVGPTQQLISAGVEINDAITALGSARQVQKGNSRTVFDAVLNDMSDLVNRTGPELFSLEKQFEIAQASGYDLWGDLNQFNSLSNATTWKVSNVQNGAPLDVFQEIKACPGQESFEDGGASLRLPANGVVVQMVPPTYRMARDLGLGTVEVCYANPSWVNAKKSSAVSWSLQMSLDIEAIFIPDTTAGLQKKTAAVSKGSKSEPFLIAHARDISANKFWTFNCTGAIGQNAIPDGLKIILQDNWPDSIKRCMANGPGPQERLKGATFHDMYYGCNGPQVGCLVNTFQASGHEQEPARVANDLKAASQMLKERLFALRQSLAWEIADLVVGKIPDTQFVAEDKARIAKEFRQIKALSIIIQLYSSLLMSHSVRADDAVVGSLLSITPERWASRIQIVPKNVLESDKESTATTSRTFKRLGLQSKFAAARRTLDMRLRKGVESYDLVASTLKLLNDVQYLQITAALPPAHLCFKRLNTQSTAQQAVVAAVPWNDQHRVSKIGATIDMTSGNTQDSRKANVVISTPTLLLTGIAIKNGDSPKLAVSFQGNGMTLADLKTAGIKMCIDAPSTDMRINVFTVTIADDSGQELKYADWNHIDIGSGSGATAIVFQAPQASH
jgi:hypothetical protein